MTTAKILVFQSIMAFSTVHATQAYDQDCALALDTVLEKAAEARGKDALAKLNALRVKSKHFEGKWNPDFDYRIMKPGYMVMTATYSDGVVIKEGFDGERAWEDLERNPEPVYVEGDAYRGLAQGAHSPIFLYGLHDMEEMGAEVSKTGCATVDETAYYLVRVKATFGTDIEYYVNAKSFLVERARATRALHPTLDATQINIEERWDDFRWIDGVLFPFAYSQWDMDKDERLSRLEVRSVEVDAEASPALFEKP